jgi:O-antigen/teichoic acid export membrane protein
MELQEDSISEQDTQSQEPTLKEKTAKGLFWGGISNGVQQVLAMVFGIILARTLEPEDYGLVGMLTIFTAIATIIINCGFSTALTNKLDAAHKDYNAVFWFSFFTGLLLYIILYFFAPLIALFYGRPELTNLSRIIFSGFFFSGIAIVPYTILFKKLMVKQQAQIDISATLLSGLTGVILVLNGFSYWSLAIQGVSYSIIGSCLRCIITPWRPTFHIDFSPLKKIFSFSSKMLFTNILYQINSTIFTVILGKFYDATQLGYYSQGNKWMGMLHQLIGGAVNFVVQPVIVQVNHNEERETRVFRKMIRFISFISFPAFIGLAFIANEFITITLGEKWLPSVLFLQILCGLGIIASFYLLYTQLIISHGKSAIYFKGILLTGISQIIMFMITYHFGIVYMVIGYVVNFFLSMFFWHYNTKKYISIKVSHILRDTLPYFTITMGSIFISFILTYNMENIYLKISGKILLTAIIYISILYLSKSKILMDSINLIKNKKESF